MTTKSPINILEMKRKMKDETNSKHLCIHFHITKYTSQPWWWLRVFFPLFSNHQKHSFQCFRLLEGFWVGIWKINIIILVRSVFAPLAFIIIHYYLSHKRWVRLHERQQINLWTYRSLQNGSFGSRLVSQIQILLILKMLPFIWKVDNFRVDNEGLCTNVHWTLLSNNPNWNLKLKNSFKSKKFVFFSFYISTVEMKIKWKFQECRIDLRYSILNFISNQIQAHEMMIDTVNLYFMNDSHHHDDEVIFLSS